MYHVSNEEAISLNTTARNPWFSDRHRLESRLEPGGKTTKGDEFVRAEGAAGPPTGGVTEPCGVKFSDPTQIDQIIWETRHSLAGTKRQSLICRHCLVYY